MSASGQATAFPILWQRFVHLLAKTSPEKGEEFYISPKIKKLLALINLALTSEKTQNHVWVFCHPGA